MEWMEIGYLGLFLACFLAATIIPFSSEVVLFAFLSTGFSPLLSILFASLGNTAGGMTSYGLGWLGNRDTILKILRVDAAKLDRLSPTVARIGQLSALFTWLPFIGDLIAIILGLFKSNWLKTLLLMALGKTIRYVLVVWAHGFLET